jgi:hypothetical protein
VGSSYAKLEGPSQLCCLLETMLETGACNPLCLQESGTGRQPALPGIIRNRLAMVDVMHMRSVDSCRNGNV